MRKIVKAITRHRTIYGGMAVIYGAGFAEVVDKPAVMLAACLGYLVMACRG